LCKAGIGRTVAGRRIEISAATVFPMGADGMKEEKKAKK
jgi:hypothetical protein